MAVLDTGCTDGPAAVGNDVRLFEVSTTLETVTVSGVQVAQTTNRWPFPVFANWTVQLVTFVLFQECPDWTPEIVARAGAAIRASAPKTRIDILIVVFSTSVRNIALAEK